MSKPPHDVWKSKLAMLAWLINKAIDNGNYDIDIETIYGEANKETIFKFLKENLPTHRLMDFSLFTAEDEAEINRWFLGTAGNYDAHIKNKGLCLVLAWTIEMMQHAGDPEDSK